MTSHAISRAKEFVHKPGDEMADATASPYLSAVFAESDLTNGSRAEFEKIASKHVRFRTGIRTASGANLTGGYL
jgi:hypothetical protein